jgi:hypothetical protein
MQNPISFNRFIGILGATGIIAAVAAKHRGDEFLIEAYESQK